MFIVLVSESHGFFGQKRKFERFFSPKTGDLQSKKRSSPKLRRIFRPNSKIQTFFQAESRQLLQSFGTQIPLGGLFSFFQQKLASKAPKTCDFAYFKGQWGRLEPPWLRYWLESIIAMVAIYMNA